MSAASPRRLRIRALAKLNLSLHVLGSRPDGYHEVRTVLQSIALHDTLTLTAVRGAFAIECDDPGCPVDESNLVWRAAERLWRADRRRGAPSGVRIAIRKRIPMQAGLGGGSSDAAAALRALALLWGIGASEEALRAMAGEIGADTPFFLEGGTVLGLDRGDRLYPLLDRPAGAVVIVVPDFGVRSKDAYDWWDARRARGASGDGRTEEWVNGLQAPVAERHPEIARIAGRLRRAGATHAAMSGSGSAVFGVFEGAERARQAAAALAGSRSAVVVTRTVNRRRYRVLCRARPV